MRLVLFLIIASLLAGCIKSNWIHERKSTGIFDDTVEDSAEWGTYELSKEDFEAARKSEFPDLAKPGDSSPLMVALAKESSGTGTTNCRDVEDPFKCILAASEQRKPSYSYLTRFGTDSMYGWGMASRADGGLIVFSYDSSPCGGVSCGYSLAYRVCEVKAELVKQKSRRQKTVCLKPLISF